MLNFKKNKELVYNIIGSAMTVHRVLNWGLLEPLYNEALCLELAEKGIACESEKLLPCFYKGIQMEKFYKMDVVVEDEIIVELKSVKELLPAHRAQLFNYMRLTKKPIGLLINFGQPSLQSERYAYIEETNECVLLDKDMNLLYPEYPNWDVEENEEKTINENS
jgi:GxxExxY protein